MSYIIAKPVLLPPPNCVRKPKQKIRSGVVLYLDDNFSRISVLGTVARPGCMTSTTYLKKKKSNPVTFQESIDRWHRMKHPTFSRKNRTQLPLEKQPCLMYRRVTGISRITVKLGRDTQKEMRQVDQQGEISCGKHKE